MEHGFSLFCPLLQVDYNFHGVVTHNWAAESRKEKQESIESIGIRRKKKGKDYGPV